MQDAKQAQAGQATGHGWKRYMSAAALAGCLVAGPIAFHVSAADKAPTKIASKTAASSRDENSKHPLVPALTMAKSSLKSLQEVKDYSALFNKRERLNEKDKPQRQVMDIKVRTEPFSVYLKYQEPHAGREVIYVEGQNKGNFLVHEDGIKAIAGTLAFLPSGPEAMAENRYPVTKIGLHSMLEITIAQWESELQYDETIVRYFPSAKIGDIDCKMVETSHPQARPHFKFHKTLLYIDKSNNLPIRVEQYGFPQKAGEAAPLIEEYTYTNLKTNTGLGNIDFDTKNKAYNF